MAQLTQAELFAKFDGEIVDNDVGQVKAHHLREGMKDLAESSLNKDYDPGDLAALFEAF